MLRRRRRDSEAMDRGADEKLQAIAEKADPSANTCMVPHRQPVEILHVLIGAVDWKATVTL